MALAHNENGQNANRKDSVRALGFYSRIPCNILHYCNTHLHLQTFQQIVTGWRNSPMYQCAAFYLALRIET